MIAALVSSYREGHPLLSTIRSALVPGIDFVYVCEGAIEGASETGEPSPFRELRLLADKGRLVIETTRGGGSAEVFADDAAKRSHMLRRAKTLANERRRSRTEPLWVLWLDGDELLLFGEYLADVAYRAGFETGAGGFPIRIVELDGSVAMSYGKVIRADVIARYLHSSYQVELTNGMVVALPNVKVCSAGGVPFLPGLELAEVQARQDELLAVARPPLAGEPHLLHRSLLRSPERGAERQSQAESRWFAEILGPDGEVLREVPR